MKHKTLKLTAALLCIISSSIFAQNESVFSNKALSLSYSQRKIYGFSQYLERKVSVQYSFITTTYTQHGLTVEGCWFKDIEEHIPFSTKLLNIGIANNLQILPLFNVANTRLELFAPIFIGTEYSSTSKAFRFIYEYGIGGKLYVTKNVGLFTQITNTAYSYFNPFYTGGVTFKL